MLLLILRLTLAFVATVVVIVAVLAVVPPPLTAFMVEDSIHRGGWIDYRWTSHTGIAPLCLVAMVAAEDQRFAEHSGFDFQAIESAAKHNSRGGSVRGASTISQQVAKNLFLWPDRSWLRKALEAPLTVIVEKIWTKRRILDVYANVAELGDGIYGIGAASRHYFSKTPGQLTAPECALLAAVLPDPESFRADAPSPFVRHRQQWILRQMDALGGTAWLRRINASPPASGPP
ncbi:MAG TPA: monofunctional biosynthetic peptidoglycan transglycosylase [Candidatus Binatia bacterium]